MVDCKGTQLNVGDAVRFFGTGVGSLHLKHWGHWGYKRAARGIITKIDANVAHIQVRQGTRVVRRFGSEILKQA